MDSANVHHNNREYTHNYWKLWGGRKLPKPEIVYLSQIVILYIIIIVSLINLSLDRGENALWISLLSLCIGVRNLLILSSYMLMHIYIIFEM
jgi:hypothetical protein